MENKDRVRKLWDCLAKDSSRFNLWEAEFIKDKYSRLDQYGDLKLSEKQEEVLRNLEFKTRSEVAAIQHNEGVCTICSGNGWMMEDNQNVAYRCDCKGGTEALVRSLLSKGNHIQANEVNKISKSRIEEVKQLHIKRSQLDNKMAADLEPDEVLARMKFINDRIAGLVPDKDWYDFMEMLKNNMIRSESVS
jgi:hypothetical protein